MIAGYKLFEFLILRYDSQNNQRASSVIVHVNRDLRYVRTYIFICGRTSTSMRMPKKVLLRNSLSNKTVTAAQVSRGPVVSIDLELRTK